MSTSTSTTTMVSADSLRAAALSTLKAKRRKPAPERTPVPPSRPIPSSDALALDYGQEEQAQPRDTSAPPTISPKPVVAEEKEKSAPVVEEAPVREEGEISEEDEPPPPPKPIPLPPKPTVVRRRQLPSRTPPPRYPSRSRRTLDERQERQPPPPSPPPRKEPTPVVTKPTPPPPPVLLDRISSAPAPDPIQLKQEPMDISLDSLRLEDQVSYPIVGPDRVRPGLNMTQEQYNIVKDIILDLLGWGVPFDYLVQCGVSREAIFYVFTELNLRIPESFDVSGIVPYTPESLAMSQRSTLMPPPPIPDKQRRDSAESPTSAMVISSPKAGPSITAPVASTSTIESPLAADLHDMERQRRAELLARKAAVQASRKMKQSLSAASSSDTAPTGEPTPPAATEAVEDFLKSLAPTEAKEPSPLIVSSPGPIEEPAAMDVDQEPYKKATEQALEQFQELPPMSAVSEQFSMSSRSPVPETPPTSVESTSTSFPPSSTSTPGPGTPGLPGAASRRSLKRPVASDFVDVDPAPKRHESEGRPVQSNGVPRPVGITRRLNSGPGFSNIGSRRCVIDLSDSEDDGEAQEVEEHAIQSKAIPYSPAPLKPVSRLSTSSPAALMQKEMEIRKMRELIAQREEETRLRKLALTKSAAANAVGTSRSSTPAAQLPPNLNAEPDVVMAPPTADIGEANGLAPQGSRSSESSTPPPSAEPSARTLAQSSIENGDIHAGPHETSVSDDDGQGASPGIQEAKVACADDQDIEMSHDGTLAQSEEGSVDVDHNPSPSTQMRQLSIPPALPEQEERKQEISQTANANNDDDQAFTAYRSPFESYPLLLRQAGSSDSVPPYLDMSSSSPSLSHMYPSTRPSLSSDSPHVHTELSSASSPYSSFITSSAGVPLPNLQPLKRAAWAKVLNPTKRLCQYEFPGGGTCRDERCPDIHLSRLQGDMGRIEPSDEDTAYYLFNALPVWWLQQCHVQSPSRILSALQHVHQQTSASPLSFKDRVTQALDTLGPTPT